MIRNRMLLAAGLCLSGVLFLISGCSGESQDEPLVQAVADESLLLNDVELAERSFECIEDKGFQGQLDLTDPVNGPNYTFTVPPEREAAYEEATDECAEFFLEQGWMRPTTLPTREEMEERFTFLLAAAECLKAEGVVVPEPPSLDAYVDSLTHAWVPHASVDSQVGDQAELERIFLACPQFE